MKTLLNSLFEKALSVVKSKLVLWLIIACLCLCSTVAYLYNSNVSLKQDNKRHSDNFEQLNSENKVLNLTVGEYKLLMGRDKEKIDSLLKVIDERPKYLKSATVINIEYKDTNSIQPIYLAAEKQPNSESFIIPIEVNSDCWGFKGSITSKDPKTKLEINERTSINSVQLVVIKKKKFLFWTVKKEQFKGFSDCGELNITQINFVK